MGYCSESDIPSAITELMAVRLSDDAGDGETDSGIISDEIERASAEIDGYIGSRVALPLNAPYPETLTKYCIDITVWNLYSRIKETIPELRKSRYDSAIRWLERYADGHGWLPGVDGAGTEGTGMAMKSNYRDAYFDLDKY